LNQNKSQTEAQSKEEEGSKSIAKQRERINRTCATTIQVRNRKLHNRSKRRIQRQEGSNWNPNQVGTEQRRTVTTWNAKSKTEKNEMLASEKKKNHSDQAGSNSHIYRSTKELAKSEFLLLIPVESLLFL
jgi:hypothetical protein